MRGLLPLFLLSLAACGGGGAREAAPGVSLLGDFSIAETSPAGAKWKLNAEKGRMDERRNTMIFSSPDIKFYDGGAVSSEITARFGSLKMGERSAVLNDDVVVDARKDGMRLTTTRLYYSSARGKIWTEEPLIIYRGRTVTRGRGFTANPDLSEIEIHHQETRLGGQK